MASPSISLKLSRETFCPGQVIDGTIRLTTEENCACKELNLTMIWATISKKNGNSTSVGISRKETLFSGDVKAGETLEIPFSLIAPQGPYTYEGQRFVLQWSLVATNTNRFSSSKATRSFSLVPTKDSVTDLQTTGYKLMNIEEDQLFSRVFWVLVCMVLGGAGLLVYGFLAYYQLNALHFFGLFLLGLGFYAGHEMFWELFVRLLFAKGIVQPEQSVVSPGDPIRTTVTLSSFWPKPWFDTSLWVMAREETADAVITRFCPVVSKIDLFLQREHRLPTGDIVWEWTGELPDNVPFSFSSGTFRLRWYVIARLRFLGFSIRKYEIPLTIAPTNARRLIEVAMKTDQRSS